MNNIDVHQWVEQHFSKGKVPPFSFILDGKKSDKFIKNWNYSAEKINSNDLAKEEFVYTYSDKKSGLVVKCLVTCFNDFHAVEWVLRFSNASEKNSPLIEKVWAIDHQFKYDRKGTFILHHANGSNTQPSDFMPLDDSLQIGKNIKMIPN